MLAQSFKSALQLGITERQLAALQKTLVMLETDKLTHSMPDQHAIYDDDGKFSGLFNMAWWDIGSGCGTICCIGGTAELIGGLKQDELDDASSKNPELKNLFYPGIHRPYPAGFRTLESITPTEAAAALRSYLTTGNANWHIAAPPPPCSQETETPEADHG